MKSMDIAVDKQRIIGFIWQHILLLLSLFLLALGVAICIRSSLGSSVISALPYSFTLAGEDGLVPQLTLGMYTNILNVLLVLGQIIVLRKNFNPIQLLQLFIGVVFGVLIDLSMIMTTVLITSNIPFQLIEMVAGSSIMALGVAMEIRCASITMPGEGLPAALSKLTGKPFANMKINVDLCLVLSAIISMFIFFGTWRWNIVGVGTLFAAIYCGMAVKFINKRLDWFDRLLGYQPGFRRYFFGLAQYLQTRLHK